MDLSKCGRGFANRNQYYIYSDVRPEQRFAGRNPKVVATRVAKRYER